MNEEQPNEPETDTRREDTARLLGQLALRSLVVVGEDTD